MRLAQFLQENKGELQERWVNLVLDCYAEDAAAIFKREQDRFANPVGYSTRHTLSSVYSLLFDESGEPGKSGQAPDLEQVRSELDTFIKLRAVQTFTPASAVAFVYDLKKVVREATAKERNLEATATDWQRFHDLLDAVALLVFDLYAASRERLFQTQLNEYKSMNFMHTRHGCSAAGMADKTTQLLADVQPLHTHSNEAR